MNIERRCAVCDKIIDGNAYKIYYAYSHKDGKERAYSMCVSCDRHYAHAAFVVDNKAQAYDKA